MHVKGIESMFENPWKALKMFLENLQNQLKNLYRFRA